MKKLKPLADRFWPKVNKASECWIWTGAKRAGYGMLGASRRGLTPLVAHRVSYEFAYGPIPEGAWVLHNCPGGDNRACVNPAHLWLGTNSDNVKDNIQKTGRMIGRNNPAHTHPERHVRGERHENAKLTDGQVIEIRRAYASGEANQRELSERFGVCQTLVSLIVRKKRWQHL